MSYVSCLTMINEAVMTVWQAQVRMEANPPAVERRNCTDVRWRSSLQDIQQW